MIFLSFNFLLFFILLTFTYYFLSMRGQNLLLLLASILYLSSWSPHFVLIHLVATVGGFFFGEILHIKKKRSYLYFGIAFQVCNLLFFKYIWSGEEIIFIKNGTFSDRNLNLLIPLGISFYTFQIISYLFDIYRGEIKKRSTFSNFYLFTIYFPKILMGPIERFGKLTLEFNKRRRFRWKNIREGGYLFSLGLLKRLIIINIISPYYIRSTSDVLAGENFGLLLLIEILFGYIYFYCDFSSYMNFVRGLSKTLGIEMSLNFNQPYFSKDPISNWQRWHSTLTYWIRDYIYYPLLLKTKKPIFSIFILFLCLGFFHEVSFRFVAWALYWTWLYILYTFYRRNIKNKFSFLKRETPLLNILKVTVTFTLVAYNSIFSWVSNFQELILLTLKITFFEMGNSVFTELGAKQLILLLFSIILIIFQETRYNKIRNNDIFEKKWEILAVLYFNIIFSFSFGVFEDYPFQYINF